MDIMPLIGIVISLMTISYVFRPNVAFSLLAAIITGSYSGHFLATNWPSIVNNSLIPASQILTSPSYNSVIAIVGLILVAMMFTTWSNRFRWLARYPTSVMAGTGLGIVLRAMVGAQLISLIDMTISLPIATNNLVTSFSNVFFIVAFCLTLFYFLVGFDLKGPLQSVNKVARVVILAMMGAQAANMTWDVGGRITPWLNIQDMINRFLASL